MTLYLIRGLPGSGKSTYAQSLAKSHDCFHVEADMYFCRDGIYRFDGSRIRLAHQWCQDMAQIAMEKGKDVVVSNTFTQRRELQPYLDLAKATGHTIKIVNMDTSYGNIHNVPVETLEKMKDRWENIEGALDFSTMPQ